MLGAWSGDGELTAETEASGSSGSGIATKLRVLWIDTHKTLYKTISVC